MTMFKFLILCGYKKNSQQELSHKPDLLNISTLIMKKRRVTGPVDNGHNLILTASKHLFTDG